MSFVSIIISIIILGVLIIVHEFGHFIIARKNGVFVKEFSIGFGPRIVSHKCKTGMLVSWKAIPFGGSCQMLGVFEDEDEGTDDERSYDSKSVWARMSITLAGPVFNFLLAWVMACILLGSIGVDRPVLLEVTKGFPAEAAGLQAGDEIISIGGRRVFFYREVSDYVSRHQEKMASGESISVVYRRDGAAVKTAIVPKADENGSYKLGIVGSTYYRDKVGFFQTLGYGAAEVRYWIDAVFEGLRMMFTGRAGLDDISGPVGVVEVIDETYQQSKEDGAYYVWLNLLNLAILLSANLGVMNLLPIPALDGGRLLLLLVEAVRGKRLDPRLEGRIHLAGFAVLMALMVFIMGNDVRKLIFRG